jgi:hypothetical protein
MPTLASSRRLPADMAKFATIMLPAAATLTTATAIATKAAAAVGNPPTGGAPHESADNSRPPAGQGGGALRVQPSAGQFTWPNRPDVAPSRAREVDELFHELMGGGASPLSDVDDR